MPATPVSIPVNKEEVRLAVLELGYNTASQRLGIKAATLRQWAKRFSWNVTRTHAQETVTTVTRPSVAVLDELAENERETKLSLSRYTKRASKDAENAKLRDAPYVKQVAQTAGITFKWNDREQSNNTVVNIALLGVDPEAVRAVQDNVQTLDIESECQGSGD